MKKTLELAGITASVVIGAGFATGREIRTYFTKYGNLSYFIIAGVAVLLYVSFLKLMSETWDGGQTPGDKIIAVPYVFFGYILMLAATGQLVQDYTGLPSIAGVFAGAVLSVIGLVAGFGRFTRFSGWLTPVVAVVLVATLFRTGVRPPAVIFSEISLIDVCLSSVKFIGYNFLSAFIILPEIKSGYTRRQKVFGVALGVLGLTVCMVIINRVFLGYGDVLKTYQMPLIQVICNSWSTVVSMVAVSLLSVIFVLSLCTSAVGVARMIGHGKMESKIGVVFITLALPLSLFGFGNLMDKIYPMFGFCGFFMLLKRRRGPDPRRNLTRYFKRLILYKRDKNRS